MYFSVGFSFGGAYAFIVSSIVLFWYFGVFKSAVCAFLPASVSGKTALPLLQPTAPWLLENEPQTRFPGLLFLQAMVPFFLTSTLLSPEYTTVIPLLAVFAFLNGIINFPSGYFLFPPAADFMILTV